MAFVLINEERKWETLSAHARNELFFNDLSEYEPVKDSILGNIKEGVVPCSDIKNSKADWIYND